MFPERQIQEHFFMYNGARLNGLQGFATVARSYVLIG